MQLTSRQWWWLRTVWHRPDMWRMMSKPRIELWPFDSDLPKECRYTFRENVTYAGWLIKRQGWKIIRRDLRTIRRRIIWWLAYTQPLHCGGDGGGWRTRVCEWLEMKAREAENREYPPMEDD